MFTFTVSAYIQNLTKLHAILEKAKVWQVEQKISDEAIMNSRLALDQFTFAKQVRSATNFAKNSAEALCKVTSPTFEDNENNLSDLQARVETVITFLQGLTEDMTATDLDTRIIPLPWMQGKGLYARYFVEVYAHKNFYFHYTTAYSILRHYGLSIGKSDYMTTEGFQDLA